MSGTVHLNQNTGKYEHRDENYVVPTGKVSCPGCGEEAYPDELQHHPAEPGIIYPTMAGGNTYRVSDPFPEYTSCPACR